MEKPITQNKRTPLETVIPLETPYIISVDPSGACNFSCNFCACNTTHFLDEERHKIMEWDLFKKIIDDIGDFKEQVKVINLHGFGEPLLNKRLPEMVGYIKQKNASREVRITTNGSLLNPAINQQLVEAKTDLIRISIEALTSEEYKSICNCTINFDDLVFNIEDLYKRSRGITKISAKIINAAIKNEAEVQRFYGIFESITDFHYIEEVEEYWPEFREVKLPKEVIKANKLYHENMRETTICSSPLIGMMVHSNGLVGACLVDWKFELCYGDAKKEHLRDIWHSKKSRELQLSHLTKNRSEIPFCKDCKYLSQDYISPKAAEKIIENIKEMEKAERLCNVKKR